MLPTSLFAFGQSRVSADVAGAFLNLEPLVGAILGMALFAEPAGPVQVAGGAAITVGIGLSSFQVVRGERRRFAAQDHADAAALARTSDAPAVAGAGPAAVAVGAEPAAGTGRAAPSMPAPGEAPSMVKRTRFPTEETSRRCSAATARIPPVSSAGAPLLAVAPGARPPRRDQASLAPQLETLAHS